VITGELKSKVDRVWDAFWPGGISNGLTVIEQVTYLLFVRRLDELHTAREKKANLLKKQIEEPIFLDNDQEQSLRWSRFKDLGSPEKMYELSRDKVFPVQSKNLEVILPEPVADRWFWKPPQLVKECDLHHLIALETACFSQGELRTTV
jgi:HsdM N-terminal domain